MSVFIRKETSKTIAIYVAICDTFFYLIFNIILFSLESQKTIRLDDAQLCVTLRAVNLLLLNGALYCSSPFPL